jgi:hypothetical protein
MRAQALSKTAGDVTDIECPDPQRPGGYIKIGEWQSGDERATIALEGHMALQLRSTLLRLAQARCAYDIQLHFGNCEDLSNFHDFKKALILESARGGTYDTDELGSLESEDEGQVDERLDTSALRVYDTVTMTFAERAQDIVTNEILDIVICDAISCGECEDESDGCEKVFAVTTSAGGSPGTPPDVVYSIDGGVTWYAHDIEAFATGDTADAVACVSGYLVPVSNSFGGLAYADLDEFDGVSDPVFTGVTTGFVAGGEPRDIWSVGTRAWIVGDFGYVYVTDDPTGGVSVQDAGVATISQLNAVHAISRTFAVAAGNDGVVIYADDGETWQVTQTNPVGPGTNLNCIWAKNADEWWVGTDGGQVFYTLNQGETWTERAFSGSGAGEVHDIQFATDSIVYISHETATPRGRLLVSYSGGNSFTLLPRDASIMPVVDRFTAIAACQADPGFLAAGGLADDASDGAIVVGNMAAA